MKSQLVSKVIITTALSLILTSCATTKMSEHLAVGDMMIEPMPVSSFAKSREITGDRGGSITTTKTATVVAKKMVYSANIYLLVESIDESLRTIKGLTKTGGGYLARQTSESIEVRIPTAKFEGFIKDIKVCGKVTSESIVAEDVTEKMLDLGIRLKNAEELRKRYEKLLEKGGNVKDLAVIAKALAEVTEKIELYKGKIRYFKNKVAYSTIIIHLNAAIPQQDISTQIPIEWVRKIGSNVGNSKSMSFSHLSSKNRVVDFDLPPNFMFGSNYRGYTEAMSAEGIYLTVTSENSTEGGSLEFWSKIISRSLEKSQAIKVLAQETMKLDSDLPVQLIRAEKRIGRKTFTYNLAITVFDNQVYLYSAWGEKNKFNKSLDKEILESMKSMDIGGFWDYLLSPSEW